MISAARAFALVLLPLLLLGLGMVSMRDMLLLMTSQGSAAPSSVVTTTVGLSTRPTGAKSSAGRLLVWTCSSVTRLCCTSCHSTARHNM
jgi:hypothetical protein